MNAYAERFVLSAKTECLDRMIFFSEKALGRALASFVEHYHRERPHQDLDNRLIESGAPLHPNGEVQCRERPGWMLRYYHRQAA